MTEGIIIVLNTVLTNPVACIILGIGLYCKLFKRKTH